MDVPQLHDVPRTILVQTRYGRAGVVFGVGTPDQMSFWLKAGCAIAVVDNGVSPTHGEQQGAV
jgi:hypothetical protein